MAAPAASAAPLHHAQQHLRRSLGSGTVVPPAPARLFVLPTGGGGAYSDSPHCGLAQPELEAEAGPARLPGQRPAVEPECAWSIAAQRLCRDPDPALTARICTDNVAVTYGDMMKPEPMTWSSGLSGQLCSGTQGGEPGSGGRQSVLEGGEAGTGGPVWPWEETRDPRVVSEPRRDDLP